MQFIKIIMKNLIIYNSNKRTMRENYPILFIDSHLFIIYFSK